MRVVDGQEGLTCETLPGHEEQSTTILSLRHSGLVVCTSPGNSLWYNTIDHSVRALGLSLKDHEVIAVVIIASDINACGMLVG